MSQRGLILRLLREAGPEGVDAHDLIYRHGITQVGARIWELRDQGYDIETIDRGYADDGRRRLSNYVLKGTDGDRPEPPRNVPFDPTPRPLELPCGCVRAANGMAWDRRCEKHDPASQPEPEKPAVGW